MIYSPQYCLIRTNTKCAFALTGPARHSFNRRLIGRPELVSIDELIDDAWIATAAAIGAPGGLTDWQMLGVDYVKAVQLVQQELGTPVSGLMVGQNGMSSTLNGWLPSAILMRYADAGYAESLDKIAEKLLSYISLPHVEKS